MSYRPRNETPASLAVTAAGAYHRLVALVGPGRVLRDNHRRPWQKSVAA